MTHLTPMTPDEFTRWRAQSIPAYAADKVRSGRWTSSESLAEAEKEVASLLPQGLQTPNQWFFSIESADGACVGAVWLGRAERAFGPIGYVFDVVVWPAFRRQGHAGRAMQALEHEALARGCSGLALHVFGHNLPARSLYALLGYEPVNMNLYKPLAPPGADGGP